MSQHYSNPARETDPYALPDVEIFYVDASASSIHDDAGNPLEAGYYYWYCLPGCLPDSDPVGPFTTAAEALADAREQADFDIGLGLGFFSE